MVAAIHRRLGIRCGEGSQCSAVIIILPHHHEVVTGVSDQLILEKRALVKLAHERLSHLVHSIWGKDLWIAMPVVAVELVGRIGSGIEAVDFNESVHDPEPVLTDRHVQTVQPRRLWLRDEIDTSGTAIATDVVVRCLRKQSVLFASYFTQRR